jgi:hypothetical protein
MGSRWAPVRPLTTGERLQRVSYAVTIVDPDRARPGGPINSVDDLVQELLADGQDLAVVRREGEVVAYIASGYLSCRVLADARGLAGRLVDLQQQQSDEQPAKVG